jgi:hypothetical protein
MSPGDLPTGFPKLLLVSVILMSETLARGGDLMLVVTDDGPAAGFKLIAEGQQIVLADEYKSLLSAENGTDNLDARNVLAYLTALLAKRIGMKIEVSQSGPGCLEFTAAAA